MAIDPITSKLLAKITLQATQDEETRNRILIIILTPIIGLLLLIAFIVYIITSPLGFLAQWLIGDEIKVVDDFQKDYGYTQEIGIYDNDYTESMGESYEGITFTKGETQVIYYNQLDKRWADKPYGTTGTIGSSGCGPTSMSIVISTLTSENIDPIQMSEWSYKNGYRCEGNGSYHSLIPESAKAFGLTVESISQDNPQKLIDALSSGKLVVAIMSKGHFTQNGHFIILRGVTTEGKILVADPSSQSRSKMEWDIDIIINEARKGASAGGAFWAIY